MAVAAAFTAVSAVLIRKKKGSLLVGLITAGAVGLGTVAAYSVVNAESAVDAITSEANNTFTIHKTDDDGNPVPGAVFEIYGSPVDITWLPAPDVQTSDIVILYTNDVHCGVDNKVGYAGLASYKKKWKMRDMQLSLWTTATISRALLWVH